MINAIRNTFKKLISDKRGSGTGAYNHKDVALSALGCVAIGAACITGAAAAAVAGSNNASAADHEVQRKMTAVVGASAETPAAATNPFGK